MKLRTFFFLNGEITRNWKREKKPKRILSYFFFSNSNFLRSLSSSSYILSFRYPFFPFIHQKPWFFNHIVISRIIHWPKNPIFFNSWKPLCNLSSSFYFYFFFYGCNLWWVILLSFGGSFMGAIYVDFYLCWFIDSCFFGTGHGIEEGFIRFRHPKEQKCWI